MTTISKRLNYLGGISRCPIRLAEVYHLDLYGLRKDKYTFLQNNSIASINWQKLAYKEPYYFFVPKDFEFEEEYRKGFYLSELLEIHSSGIETQKDIINIFFDEQSADKLKNDFCNLDEAYLKNKYQLEEGRDWKIQTAKNDLIEHEIILAKIQYRPFDYRFTNYTGKTKGIMAYPRNEVMQNLLKNDNFALNCLRQSRSNEVGTFLISNGIVCKDTISLLDRCTTFPLYLYPE